MNKKRHLHVELSNEARILRAMRLEAGLSMRAAGKAIGRSDSYVSQLEHGRMDVPDGVMLQRILDAYGGPKLKTFAERVRTYTQKRTPSDDLQDLFQALTPNQVVVVLGMVKAYLSVYSGP